MVRISPRHQIVANYNQGLVPVNKTSNGEIVSPQKSALGTNAYDYTATQKNSN